MTGPDGELPAALQKVEPAMLELVCNEIVEQGGHVQWNDIAGQDQAKRLVQELVVWPMLNPHLFKVWSPHLHPDVNSIVYRMSSLEDSTRAVQCTSAFADTYCISDACARPVGQMSCASAASCDQSVSA